MPEIQICYCRRHDLIFCDRHGPAPCFSKECQFENVTGRPHQFNPAGCAICTGFMVPVDERLHHKVQIDTADVSYSPDGSIEKSTTLVGSYYNVWEAGIVGPASRCFYCQALVRTAAQMQEHTLNCPKHPSKVTHAEDRPDSD